MSMPILMQPPGRSTFTQSGLIELGKPVETLSDGRFVEAKIPKEPRKKKGALPEPPQPFVGPPPVISGAGKPRGAKESTGAAEPMKVFKPTVDIATPEAPTGEAVSGVKKTRGIRFEKGSQAAKDYMASLREKAKAKKAAASAPAPASAAVEAVMPKPKKGKKAVAEPAVAVAAKTDEEDDDMKLLKQMRKLKRMQQLLKEAEA